MIHGRDDFVCVLQAASDPFPLPRDPAAGADAALGFAATSVSVSAGPGCDDAGVDDSAYAGGNVSRVHGSELSPKRTDRLLADVCGMSRMSVAARADARISNEQIAAALLAAECGSRCKHSPA